LEGNIQEQALEYQKTLESAMNQSERALELAKKQNKDLKIANKESEKALEFAIKDNKHALKIANKEIQKLNSELELLKSTSSQKIADLETQSKTLEQKLLAESGRVVNMAREIETLKVKEQEANDLLRQKDQ
jgi:hypothetical protein